ncbi:MAG: rRNA adenine N-6-methyltransferase family protein [Oscillospiraceae bacterium]|nr:rRNA adenine N-6-methyltransferase family protein [Oscillospiraceae bacterium]
MPQWITTLTQKIERLATKTAAVYWIASQYYRTVIEREIALANITESDRILWIGGGVCPLSAILIHQITGAKVTVIDNDPQCIPHAEQMVARLGLDEHIQVLCQDGLHLDLPLSEYSVIHFALQVSPMDCVFACVDEQAAAGTRMLIRRPKKQLGKLYSRWTASLSTYCQSVAHKARNMDSTLLYTKPERRHEEKNATPCPAGGTICPGTVAA